MEASASAGGLGGGLEEVNKDNLVLYGSIAGAAIFGLILVVAMARALRRRANSQPMYVPTVDVEDEPDEVDDLDLSDLDDLFLDDDDDDDLDAAFADL